MLEKLILDEDLSGSLARTQASTKSQSRENNVPQYIQEEDNLALHVEEDANSMNLELHS